MIARKVKEETLRTAALETNVSLENWRPEGRGFGFVLRPAGEKDPESKSYEWQRRSHNGRRVNAVCWHGHQAYFRAVYAIEPDAVFRTRVDVWRGSEDFEARHEISGMNNIGSQFAPMQYREACECAGW